MTHPTSFTGAPALGSHHPAPTPASAPVYQGAVSVPAPAEPRLTVRANGDVTLSKALLCAVSHLRAGSPVDVVPPNPKHRGGLWHLDTRPTAVGRLPDGRRVARFRIPAPSRTHFLRPAMNSSPGQFGGAGGTAGFRDALVFVLGPEVTEEVCLDSVDEYGRRRRICQRRGTGYYELLPVR